ncbi:MAG: HtrA2 peptidase [Parcubacteria group bacterium Greene0416_79]|nr:MAG: HtrA2 peptidase [Parcubacteria group bacterium Greene0416_79]
MSEKIKNQIVSILCIVFVAIGFYLGYSNLKETLSLVSNKVETLNQRLEKTEKTLITLQKSGSVEKPSLELFYTKILPAVVFIHGSSVSASYNQAKKVVASELEDTVRGTGFFISKDGYIATAKHVIEGLDEKNIHIQSGQNNFYTAILFAKDDKTDLAILKVRGENFNAVELGFFDNMTIGEDVGLIGFNPGFTIPLVHRGNVSAKGIDNGVKVFTINSFVNKGNSGSPVFSLATGRVIGIVGAKKSEYLNRKPLNPDHYSSSMRTRAGIDPTKFTAEIYNETLKLVSEASQVGIGFIYSTDELKPFVR